MRLENKVILVTASTRGIGWEIVQACAREGAIVYMAVRDQQRGGELAQALTSKGMWVKSVYMDVNREETLSGVVELAATEEGRIDVLVNNFGTGDPAHDQDLEHTSFDDFMCILRRNLASVYLTSQAAIEPMRASGGGSIINISSVGGRYPDLARVGYGVSKAAVNFLTKDIAVQCARSRIRCNAILPGMTETDSVKQNLSPEYSKIFLRHTPLGRMGTPQEIAAAVVYLASDESSYTTGQLIEIGGGFGLPNPSYGDLIEGRRFS